MAALSRLAMTLAMSVSAAAAGAGAGAGDADAAASLEALRGQLAEAQLELQHKGAYVAMVTQQVGGED